MDAMDKEIDIVELIKSRRFFKIAIKKLFSDSARMEIKQKSRYECIDPDKRNESKSENTLIRVFTNVTSKSQQETVGEDEILNLTDGFFTSSDSSSSWEKPDSCERNSMNKSSEKAEIEKENEQESRKNSVLGDKDNDMPAA